MFEVEISQTKNQLEVLLQTAIAGEDVVITEDSKPLLKLSRIENTAPRRKAGSAKGQIVISDDFDQPLDEFREYLP